MPAWRGRAHPKSNANGKLHFENGRLQHLDNATVVQLPSMATCSTATFRAATCIHKETSNAASDSEVLFEIGNKGRLLKLRGNLSKSREDTSRRNCR